MPLDYFVVTTWKCRAFVAEALRSILLQYPDRGAFMRKARLLVLDDASPDGTQEAIRLAGMDLGIHFDLIISPENAGIGVQRQRGVEWMRDNFRVARGDTLTFVDGDDVLLRGTLERRIRRLRESTPERPIHVVGGQCVLMEHAPDAVLGQADPDGPWPASLGRRCLQYALFDGFPVDPAVEDIASLFECTTYGSNSTMDARAVLDLGASFMPERLCEDWIFFATNPGLHRVNLPDPTILYRRHANSLTAMGPRARVSPMRPLADADRLARGIAQRAWLGRLGIEANDHELDLLNLVGYLVFSFRMDPSGNTFVETPDLFLDWFASRPLYANPASVPWLDGLEDEVRALFARILEANRSMAAPVHPSGLLAAFLERMLMEAGRRAASGADVVPIHWPHRHAQDADAARIAQAPARQRLAGED